ncbi:MAG: TIGR02757 family protein [Calditerrivibrio sp.]|nr:TIGR02757 family protein [Calditerrivibrio sp.]
MYVKLVERKKRVDVNPKSVQNVEAQTHLKNKDKLYSFLEASYNNLNKVAYISSDPIFFPKTIEGNTEYISFVSSMFAYGKVAMIKAFLKSFFDHYGLQPTGDRSMSKEMYYRFQKSIDIYNLYRFICDIYERHGSINRFFLSLSNDLETAIKLFIAQARSYGKDKNCTNGYFQLFPDPEKSGLKRLRMFLRWMIRHDEIDFGIWKGYDKKDLIYPIDTHILKFAQRNCIIPNNTNNLTNAIRITDFFKSLSPIDPLKYDFTITRLGMIYGCNFEDGDICKSCNLTNICPFC